MEAQLSVTTPSSHPLSSHSTSADGSIIEPGLSGQYLEYSTVDEFDVSLGMGYPGLMDETSVYEKIDDHIHFPEAQLLRLGHYEQLPPPTVVEDL